MKQKLATLVIPAAFLFLLVGCTGKQEGGQLTAETGSEIVSIGDVSPELMATLTQELERQLAAFGTDKVPASAPIGNGSKITTMWLDFEGSGARASWYYRNQGDFDHNGEANISDLVPLAQHFGKDSRTSDWPAAQRADGDSNGVINIGDITPLAQNFGARLDGFLLQKRSAFADEGDPWMEVDNIPAFNFTDNEGFLKYTRFIPTPDPGFAYRIVPYESMPGPVYIEGTPGEPVIWLLFQQQAWPMQGYNAYHSGHSHTFGPRQADEIWTLPIEGHVLDFCPVVDYFGNIYVSSYNPAGGQGWLTSVDADGKLRWRYTVQSQLFIPPTLLSDGTIVICDNSGTVHHLTNDNKLIKRIELDAAPSLVSISSKNTNFYIADKTPQLNIINVENNYANLRYPLTGEAGSSAYLFDITNIGIAEQDGTIHNLGDNSSFELGAQVFYDITVNEGKFIYLPRFDSYQLSAGVLGALFPWNYNTAGHIAGSPSLNGSGQLILGSQVDGTDPLTGHVYGVDAESGVQDWYVDLPAAPDTDVVTDSQDYIYVGCITQSSHTGMYCLNPTTQAIEWAYLTGERLPKSPAVGGQARLVFMVDSLITEDPDAELVCVSNAVL